MVLIRRAVAVWENEDQSEAVAPPRATAAYNVPISTPLETADAQRRARIHADLREMRVLSPLKAVAEGLACVLSAEWGERIEVASLEPFGDGHSGFTYSVMLADGRGPWVLRLSPPGAQIAGPADVGRQGRIMAALHAASRPAPHVISCRSEPVVDGRAFALTELVRGETWDVASVGRSHREVLAGVVAALSSMQELPPRRTGIGDERATTPRDELVRWAALLKRAPLVRNEGDRLHDALARSCPAPDRVVLVHGDFHLGNVIFDEQGGVAAIVDWEIAELGDPLVDVGSLALSSLRGRYADEPNPMGTPNVSPTELCELAAADETRFGWFLALSCFKYAAILGYNFDLHRRGKRPDPVYEQLVGTIVGLVSDGVEILRNGPPS